MIDIGRDNRAARRQFLPDQRCGKARGRREPFACRGEYHFARLNASTSVGHLSDRVPQFIKYPRSRIEKLGIKPGQRVLLAGLEDAALDADLASRDCVVLRREAKSPVDVAMVLIDTPQKLKSLARYRQAITPDGAIWAIRPKGKATPVTEAQLREAALVAELVDVKVVSFSDTHSAEKRAGAAFSDTGISGF